MDDTLQGLDLILQGSQIPFISTVAGTLIKIYRVSQEIKCCKKQCRKLFERGADIIVSLHKRGLGTTDEKEVQQLVRLIDEIHEDIRKWKSYNKLKWVRCRQDVRESLAEYGLEMAHLMLQLTMMNSVDIKRDLGSYARDYFVAARDGDDDVLDQLRRTVDRVRLRRGQAQQPREPPVEFVYSKEGNESTIMLKRVFLECGVWPSSIIYEEDVRLTSDEYGERESKYEIRRGETRYGRSVAVHILKSLGKKDIASLHRAVTILSKVDHPNITKFLGITPKLNEKNTHELDLVSEWCENGSVDSYISKSVQAGEALGRLQIVKDIANGINYLHSRNPVVTHGDIRPAKVLITGPLRAKIAGFSRSQSSVESGKNESSYSGSRAGVYRWYAPEISDASGAAFDRQKVDVYMWSVTALFILTGKDPYHDIQNTFKLQKTIDNGTPPATRAEYFTPQVIGSLKEEGLLDDEVDQLWDLLARCWRKDPSERPSIAEALKVVQGMCLDVDDVGTATEREKET